MKFKHALQNNFKKSARFAGTFSSRAARAAQMIEHSTGNRKVLGSISSGLEAFLFSQKFLIFSKSYFQTHKSSAQFLNFDWMWLVNELVLIFRLR